METDATAPGIPNKLSLVESAKAARRWQRELDASKKWMERFTRAAHKCERAYMDAGPVVDDNTTLRSYAGKVNLFWSNVQVVLSAIYGRLPSASVERRFKDFDDDVSRVAGIMMQRILNNDIEREHDDTSAAMRDAVQDRFIAGLGQVWVRYEAEFSTTPQPVVDPLTGQPAMDPETGEALTQDVEQIDTEEADVDYVNWTDFRYSPCQRWRQCRWVARRVYMRKAKLASRFKLTEEQVAMVPMQSRLPGDSSESHPDDDVLKATPFQQAAVWEIWDRENNYVCFYVEGCSFVLEQTPDPLELEDFFPCPQPIVATTLTNAFLPRPDYAMAQDLYRELDRVNAKISHLTDAVKAAGVYDKTAAPVKQLLTTGVENALVPVDNWSAFVEKGGMKGVVDWMPIEQFVNAIIQLNTRKQQLQHDLHEVLGISDLMRGATVASETATAQTLKAQFGGARLGSLQNEVARFVSDVMRIRANIICNVFQPQTILQRSQIERTPDAALAPQALQLLKDFGTAAYSIKVTADSLSAPDWAAEKEARTEFLGATSNYLMAAAPMVAQNPSAGGFLIKLLQWAAAGFKGAETIEGVLDQAARQMEQQAATPPAPQPPSPEDEKNKASATKQLAEAEKTRKEAALIPPITVGQPSMPGQPGMPPQGPPMGPPGGMPPQGPQPPVQ